MAVCIAELVFVFEGRIQLDSAFFYKKRAASDEAALRLLYYERFQSLA